MPARRGLPGQEQDRYRRPIEYGRGRIAEEQFIARPPAHAHENDIAATPLRLAQDRLCRSDIRADRGLDLTVVPRCQIHDIVHDRLLKLIQSSTGAAAATSRGLSVRYIENGDRRILPAGGRDGQFGGTASDLSAIYRDKNAELARLGAFMVRASCRSNCERRGEHGADAGHALLKGTAAPFGFRHADEQKVIALPALAPHRLLYRHVDSADLHIGPRLVALFRAIAGLVSSDIERRDRVGARLALALLARQGKHRDR